ncbi:MAG: GNAT family N-acetyltransferase [Planctomycetota bacterium]|jgi:hypothetical protein
MDVREYIPDFRWPKDTKTVEFVRARPEDDTAINDLYNLAFSQDRSIEAYRWKYWENPAGQPYGILARDKESGEFLATSTGVRKRVWVQGREVPGILMCETSSDPNARGGGRLFKGVMQGFGVAVNDEQGIVWSYGGQSSPEAIKIGQRWFGFRIVVELVCWELVLGKTLALRNRFGNFLGGIVGGLVDRFHRARWSSPSADLAFEELERFGDEFDRLWERQRETYGVAFWRDAETLNWRYMDNPFWQHRVIAARRDGELVGYVVWREVSKDNAKIGTVLDLWHGEDKSVAEGLLDQARRAATTSGCAFLRFHIQEESVMQKAFEEFKDARRSPYEAPDRIICTPMPGSKPFDQGEDAYAILGAVMDGSNWYYCQGDCDYLD